jgi:hypothetical protein
LKFCLIIKIGIHKNIEHSIGACMLFLNSIHFLLWICKYCFIYNGKTKIGSSANNNNNNSNNNNINNKILYDSIAITTAQTLDSVASISISIYFYTTIRLEQFSSILYTCNILRGLVLVLYANTYRIKYNSLSSNLPTTDQK